MAMVLEMWLDRSIFNLPYDLGLSCYIKHINDGEHMSARHVALDLQKKHTKRKQQNKYKTKQKQKTNKQKNKQNTYIHTCCTKDQV